MRDEGIWFEPKSFGYGAGCPVAWQGWALLGGYIVGLAGLGFLLPRHWLAYTIALAGLTAALLLICARHTRGGWRWRPNGEDR